MTRPVATPYPELPMDVADASGLLGALSGGLSLLLPFFDGLTIALGATLLASALVRRPPTAGSGRDAARVRHRYLLGIGIALGGWCVLLVHPAVLGPAFGASLGLSGLPLWTVVRRPRPFGGT